jgi:hypothetical protein
MRMTRVVGTAAGLLGTLMTQPSIAGEWLLLSREGGCAPLAVLSRKLADMPPIHTPDEFEAYLKKAQLKYSREKFPAASGEAHAFRVPDAELSVVLVPRAQCTEMLQGPK